MFTSRTALLIAFAFAVMGDPVSSVAYAIEAALRALGGNLGLLLPTMALVIGIIALVIVNYHQMVGRFPQGGGDAAAAGEAFGEAWAFVPIGALIVDYVLTISISVAAGASAIVAYLPSLNVVRFPIALGLLALVAGLTWFGHLGRVLFASMTLSFVAVAVTLLVSGVVSVHPAASSPLIAAGSNRTPVLSVIFAFPVAMALATGVEAPSSAMAQLGQLDDQGRARFGRVTLWLTLLIVGGLTLGITATAVRLGIGIPAGHSTEIADVARKAGSPVLFAAFQLATTLLLLAAASSSFQAGPGLLKALARGSGGGAVGVLPGWMGRKNQHHTPYWGVVVCFVLSTAVIAASSASDQQLVLFYAVAVFLSFFVGLISMARFNWADRRLARLTLNVVGAAVVAFTLLVNLARGYPILSLGAAVVIAGGLYTLWVQAGRPRGVGSAVAVAVAQE